MSSGTYQWIKCDNYTPIPGESNASFTPNQNGDYAVIITENGCSDTSDCVSISNVGIQENGFGHAFMVYPNPSAGNFSIDLGSVYSEINILISDLSGKVIQSQTISGVQSIEFALDEPAGIYLVRILAEDKRTIVRLVKE